MFADQRLNGRCNLIELVALALVELATPIGYSQREIQEAAGEWNQ